MRSQLASSPTSQMNQYLTPKLSYGRIFLNLLNTLFKADGFSGRGGVCFLPRGGETLAAGEGDGVGVGVAVGVGVTFDCSAKPGACRHHRAANTPEPRIAITSRITAAIIRCDRFAGCRSSETFMRLNAGRLESGPDV